ncbi:hypothetical protein FACS189419_01010 [Planctomycetales bacterium]|nr:hypothetical protein FACS189419_01010 [Planctomycetales bacterium]
MLFFHFKIDKINVCTKIILLNGFIQKISVFYRTLILGLFLIFSLPAQEVPIGGEMLYGKLESTKWFPEKDERTQCKKIQRDGIFRFVVERNGIETWHPILISGHHPFESGKTYRFTVQARAEEPRTISLGTTRDGPTWDNLGFSEKLVLTKDWQSFVFTFSLSKSASNGRLDIGNFKPGVYEFRDSSLWEIKP